MDETTSITGNLVSEIAASIFFQAAKNASDYGEMETGQNDAEDKNMIDESEDDEIYEVERILKDKVKRGTRLFQVRWKGYGSEEDSWEPEENLEGASEILQTYLAELEKKKKRVSLKSDYKENSDDEDVSDSAEHEFTPEKKRIRKSVIPTKPKRSSNRTSVNTPSSNVDRVVARRRNLSKNMRWITESSGDSSGGSDEEAIAKECKMSIHPDSSTDLGKQNGTNTDKFATTKGSLKLKIVKEGSGLVKRNGDAFLTTATPTENEKSIDVAEKTSSRSKSKKSKRSSNNETPQRANMESTLKFTGIYCDHEGSTPRLVAIDNKTSKREVYELADAFMADGWSLCRFLFSRVRFLTDGSAVVAGDINANGD